MCGEFAVHQLDGVSALVRGEADAATEQVQKHVPVTSEHGSEYVRLPLVRSEPFQFFTRAAAAVIEQDRGERPATLRTPEQRVQGDRSIVYFHGFRLLSRLAFGRHRDRRRKNKHREDGYPLLCHSYLVY